MKNNKRDISIELLRITAMLMVISLHYLGNSKILSIDLKNAAIPFNYFFAWFCEYASLIAVNLFFLISGYCLCNASFKSQRLIAFWLQVLFYSIGITLIFMILGIYPPELKDTYHYTTFFLPFFYEHYWFAICYGMLYTLIPFINMALKYLGKKAHLIFLLVLIMLFANFNPLVLFIETYNDKGYGIRWALCMYVGGAFIRRLIEGLNKNQNIKKLRGFALLTYFAAIVFQLALYGFCGAFSDRSETLAQINAYNFSYNSVILFIEAAALFIYFVTSPKKENHRAGRIICSLSPLVFGVYLLHDHYLLRGLWKDLWKADAAFNKPYFILHFIAVVLAVFLIGCAVEFLRQKLFLPIYRMKWYNKIYKATFAKLDDVINENR